MDNRISGVYRSYIKQVQKITERYKKTTEEVDERGDKIEISSFVEDMRFAMKALEKVPDVRKELVERLRREIIAGRYNPPIDKIVDKMLGGE